MAEEWYLARSGKRYGPLTPPQLRRLAAEGRLTPADMVLRAGEPRWVPADSVPGLFPTARQQAGGATAPAPGTAVHEAGADLAEVRRLLSAWAALVPHHGIAEFGSAITLGSVRPAPLYPAALQTLYERREVLRKEAPYRGEDVPPPQVTEGTVTPWAYRYPEATEYRAAAVEHTVPGSQQVSDCGQCGGAGAAACAACAGLGRSPCPGCAGAGARNCSRCKGSGRAVTFQRTQRQEHCTSCHGGRDSSGQVCPYCNGTAIRFRDDYQDLQVACPGCGGRGRVRCGKCAGAGRLTCPGCRGAGQVTCDRCAGQRRTVNSLAVRQTFEPEKETADLADVPCPAEAMQALGEETDYAAVLDVSAWSFAADHAAPVASEAVRRGVRRLIGSALAKGGPERRVVRQSLWVGRAEALQVAYTYQGKRYELWLVGSRKRVFAPASPITEHAAAALERAVRLWAGGRRSEAARSLRQVWDMGRADRYCQAVYDRAGAQVPAGLRRFARAQGVFEALGGATTLRWASLVVGGLLLFSTAVTALLVLLGADLLAGAFPDPRLAQELKIVTLAAVVPLNLLLGCLLVWLGLGRGRRVPAAGGPHGPSAHDEAPAGPPGE